MKIALVEHNDNIFPGLLTESGIIDLRKEFPTGATPQLSMENLIDSFEDMRERFELLLEEDQPIPMNRVRLLPPLPRPGKILCCIGNYWEHAQREPKALNMFMKNPDAVVGPDGTICLPTTTEPWMFMHEAELAIVLRGPAKDVSEEDWRAAVFGYTCLIDVSACGEGRVTWKKGSWLGKSFDTFAPIGPCIVTADEIPDPNDLHVRLWVDEQLRHNYNTDDMEHRLPELISFATSIMTLRSGDMISCGTNHEGLGPLQDGEKVTMSIAGVGTMSLKVEDPLRRTWDKGIYMGADSTNPEAVQRHRPSS